MAGFQEIPCFITPLQEGTYGRIEFEFCPLKQHASGNAAMPLPQSPQAGGSDSKASLRTW